jgi:5-methylcytosine-specific restriction endonuclease McrA
MISVKKDFENIPERLLSEKCLEKIALALVEKNTHNFSTYFYRDGCLEILQKLYHGKCAFCETKTSAGAVLQVDHYRPKLLLSGDKMHLGYYWLAHEWSNLILICAICNRFKSNLFPIALNGVRVYKPIIDNKGKCVFASNHIKSGHFIEEIPLLLNPEIDDVESQFIIKSNGEWNPLTERGRATEDICKLNRL